jgi:hypothetical protein
MMDAGGDDYGVMGGGGQQMSPAQMAAQQGRFNVMQDMYNQQMQAPPPQNMPPQYAMPPQGIAKGQQGMPPQGIPPQLLAAIQAQQQQQAPQTQQAPVMAARGGIMWGYK